MKKSVLFMILLLPCSGAAQDSCGAIQAAKEKTYGFRPSQLDDKGRKAKSEQMDAFWKLAEEQKKAGIHCLPALLQAEQKDGFFLFDGAELLHRLDASEAATKIVLDSVQSADLNEIDPAGYLQFLLTLSKSGADIGPAAERYLKHANVNAYIPQHAMRVDRDMGALFLYGSMPAGKADQYLIAALAAEEPYARATATRILSVQMTEASYRALSQFAKSSELAEVYHKEMEASRTHVPYEAPKIPAKFTRQEVLEYIRLIPQTREEYQAAIERQLKYEEQHPEPSKPAKGNVDQYMKNVAEGPPFSSLSGHDRFIESAIATLKEDDLPFLREARRKSIRSLSDESLYEFFAYTTIIRGIVNRLDLYMEYRVH